MSDWIPVIEPLLDGTEFKYVADCIASGWISSEGEYVSRFEQGMAETVGRKFGIAVCNGTAALELAVASLRLEPGSEIIVPTFTIVSCVAAILRNRCVPVLVDSDPETWNMDPEAIEPNITPRTRAIMAVHLYGLPADMDTIAKLAETYGLFVIEDASQSIGQTYRGKPCGSFGNVSVFSFYANKHITTGEGGMIMTDDERIAARCRSLRNLAHLPDRRFVHEELGYNFRMSNLQAAVGLAQLERLDRIVARKREMGAHYNELLADVEGIQLPLPATPQAENIYWVYGIVLDDAVPCDAKIVMADLAALGIGTRPFFWPMHEQPVFRKAGLFAGQSHPVAERIARRGFYIPSGLKLTAHQRICVADALKRVLVARTRK